MRVLLLKHRALVLILLALCYSATATPPPILSHQGRLLDADGQPLNGSIGITYRIFNDSTGGNLLWEESRMVDATDGLFATALGTETPIDPAILKTGQDLYLEMQIGSDTPMAPRTQINSQPFALVASSVSGDIQTDPGMIRLDATPSFSDSDDDGITVHDSVGSAGQRVIKNDGLGTSHRLLSTVHEPGQPEYANITFERVEQGQSPDTGYGLEVAAKVRVEKFRVRQQFGPVQATRQAADTGRSWVEALSIGTNDSVGAIMEAKESRAVLKTFFETGDKPTESQFSATVESASISLIHDSSGGSFTTDVNDQGVALEGKRTNISGGGGGGRVVLSVPGTYDISIDQLPHVAIHEDDGTSGVSPLYQSRMSSRGFTLVDSLGRTTGSTRSQDDGVIRTTTWTQTGGPFKFSSQTGSLESGVHVSLAGELNGGRATTHGLSVDDTSAVRTIYFDDLNLSEPHVVERVDSSESYESKAAAERAFDAVVSVENGVKDPPGSDSVTGLVMSRVIRNNGSDSTTMFQLKSTPGGGSMFFADAVGDTTLNLSPDGIVDVNTADGSLAMGDLNGDGRPDLVLTGPSGDISLGDLDLNGSPDLAVAGNARVGTFEPLATLTVGGDICATGAIGACSDERYKKHIGEIDDALDKVRAMNGVVYEWRTDEFPSYKFDRGQQFGVIAQEIMDVAPEVVSQSENGYLSVDYGKLTPLLIEAVKQQQETIEEQKNEIDQLKERLVRIEQYIARNSETGNTEGRASLVSATVE